MAKFITFYSKNIPSSFTEVGTRQPKTFKPMKEIYLLEKLSKDVKKYVASIEQVNPYCPEATEYGDKDFCKFAVQFKEGYGYEVGSEVFGVAFFDSIFEINCCLLNNVVDFVEYSGNKYKANQINKKSYKAFIKACGRGSLARKIIKKKNALKKLLGL